MFKRRTFQNRPAVSRFRWKAIAFALAALSPAAWAQPWVGDNAYCYAFADGGDQLISMRKDGTNPISVGGGAGVSAIEAIAFDPSALVNPDGNPTSCGVLYGTNAGQFGWMHLDDSCYTVSPPGGVGGFIPIGGGVGNCNHPTLGVQAVNDVDGLQFDINTGVLWGTERNGGIDFILQINPVTGTVVPNSFPAVGPGVSCVSSANVGTRLDVDDIAIDPTNSDMYVVNNQAGSADLLLQINPADGSLIRLVGPFGPGGGVFDMEGLSFGILGQTMYGTTGTAGNPANSLWSITPKTTGLATQIGPFTIGSDHEGVACMTDNVITGTVYLDVDQNALYEPPNGDGGQAGVTVRLYADTNGNGLIDDGNPPFATTTTDAAGFYFFNVATSNPFVMDIDTTTLPVGAVLTTDNLEAADFRTPSFPFKFGNREENNDFGFFGFGDLDIDKTSTPSSPLTAGGTIDYRIEVTNNTGNRHTGITVSDVLPPGVAYVAGSTVATGPRPLQVRDEFDSNSFSNQDGINNWATNWIEDASETASFPGSLQPGNVYISAGLLHLKDQPDTGTQPSVARQVDLSAGLNTARLTFDFQTTAGVDAGDAIVVEVSSGGIGGTYTVLETFTGLTGVNGGSRSYDISGFISATTAVRFRVSVGYGGTNEYFFVNDVEISAITRAAGSSVDVLDQFGTSSFANQDGPDNWAANWVENDVAGAGPGAGNVFITGGLLNLDDQPDTGTQPSLARAVNLTGTATANLTFNFQTTAGVDASDAVVVEMSSAGTGGPYTVLETFTGLVGIQSGSRNFNVSGFIGATTAVRFRVTNLYGGANEFFQVDNVRILATMLGAPIPVSLDNGGVSTPQLTDGVSPNLVEKTDGFNLETGETLVVTFQVTVDNPLDQNITRFLNLGVADSDQSPPATDQTSDPVVKGLIGDRVWLDVDGDGVQDVGEPGIANVTVELRDGICTPGSTCPTAITDANGNYFFAYLPPGSFNVFVDVSTLPAGLAPSAGNTNPRGPSVITADQEFFEVDFGYTNAGAGTAIIGDRVWSDADNDGIQDPGEVGLAGVTVNLVGPGPDGIFGTGDDVVVAMRTTGPDGTYLFTGVAPGEYIVDVASGVPAGYTLTAGPQSNPDPTRPITVISGDIVTDADFGYFNPATFSISDRVWLDANSDGAQAGAEPGLSGVTVSLLNSSGEVIATTVTDANGDFSFDGLPNGNYTIQISDTDGELNGLGGTTTDAMVNQRPVTIAGADISGVNFGYNAPGVIGDTVFSDSDGDGVQDPGELGISGVTVQLWQDADGNGIFDNTVDTLIDTAVTAADGTYLFAGLLPGTFFASVDNGQAALAGYTATTTDQETGGNAPGTQIEAPLVGLNDSFLDADFGYRNSALPDVSGTVFLDVDADGTHEPNGADGMPATSDDETGFSGVTVSLVSDPDGIPDTGDEIVLATVPTNANGDYTFPDVPAGDYQVVVTDTAGILDGYTLTSGLDERPITVAAADITDIDFGYVRSSDTGSIGDTVWLDVDPPGAAGPDGVRGPTEAGLSGVTLQLYRDADGDGVAEPGGDDGAPIATTVTDANGNYVFPNLPAGTYFVDVDGATLPAGLVATVGTTDPSAVIGLSDGEQYVDADFGYLPSAGTALVGDFVWYDADSDGQQDPGEVGIGGVTVELLDGTCTPSVDCPTTTTSADGSYLFTGLPPGDYFVVFDPATLPAGYNTTPTNTGTDSTYSVTLLAGDVITSLDWGFDSPPGTVGSIGDFVWLDVDGDGLQDAGEAGIPEVTINLIDPISGAILATTTTDASGNYLFSGLPLGVGYQVQVSDVGRVLGGLNLSTALPGTLTPTGGTPNITNADFGYAPSNGTGSIGTNFWRDLDVDGFRDVGEPPIQGVTVDVWRDLNGNGIIEPGLDNLVRTVVSDVNGEFELKSLPFGDYVVDVTDTSGVLAGLSQTFGTPNVDDNSQSEPYPVTLSAASPNNVTADFGYRDNAVDLPASISGTVFLDDDLDGIFDDPPEPVVENVEVLLYRILANGSRALVGRTFSDVNGDYSFTGLPPGNYEVAVRPAGTSAAGRRQSTQTGTGGVQPVLGLLAGQNSVDNDFGFEPPVTTTPVTLSYFSAAPDKSGHTAFEWHTATEVGHIGFNLWVQRDGQWQKLNDAIIPSLGADSIEQRQYRHQADAAGGSRFMVEDLDIRGESRFHGPFELGQPRGRRDLASEPIDWAGIGAQHARRKAERFSAQTKAQSQAVNIQVDESGVQRVSFTELAALGLSVSGSTPDLALFNGGSPVPLRVDSAGGFIEFLGSALDTLYTNTNVYTVTTSGAGIGNIFTSGFESGEGKGTLGIDPQLPNANAAAPASYRETRRVERDRQYSYSAPNGDPWFDTEILAYASPATQSFDLEIDQRLPGPVNLTVSLWGVTDFASSPDHHVVIEINGQSLADERFDGLADHPMSFQVPEALLNAGADTFQVILPGDTGEPFDLVHVDHYAVDYPRAFAARNGALRFTAAAEVFEVDALPSAEVVVYRQQGDQLQLLTGVVVSGGAGNYSARFPGSAAPATYHVASGAAILSPALEPARTVPADLATGNGQLLIISHPDFIDALAPLVQARSQQGWKVKVVNVEDLYAQYSHGIFDPTAIRDYIRSASGDLKTEAVLLVGGDTYDYHDFLSLGGISFMPSLYAPTGDLILFAPADGLYTDLDDDQVPELAIGRFPVRTSAELEVVIGRTLEFEAQSDRKSLLLSADDYDQTTGFDFTQVSEQLAQLIPEDWQVDRAYIDTLGVGGARAELLARINAGAAVTSYEGHSGPTIWSFDGLFDATDAGSLQNIGKPTVVTQWGCWTTYYVSPEAETLAHKLLLSGDRGAAAVLGATTLTEARSERALGLAVFRRLFVPGATIGEVVLQAKRELAAQGDPTVIDVLLGWNLLGDPTLSGFGSVHQH